MQTYIIEELGKLSQSLLNPLDILVTLLDFTVRSSVLLFVGRHKSLLEDTSSLVIIHILLHFLIACARFYCMRTLGMMERRKVTWRAYPTCTVSSVGLLSFVCIVSPRFDTPGWLS